MSAVKEDQDIVEKLQKALEDGVLSQNDFDKLTQAEEVEQTDEKALVGKQKKLDKNHNGKLDAQDFKMIRKEETVAEEAQTPAPERHYVTPATEANRFRGVESSIREIMSQNRDIRKIAKEEEFNRNK